jgi:hypothetical protein
MAIFFLPSNRNRGRGGAALTGGGPWAAALPGSAAVGKWGNGERQSMATDSRPRLGVGWLVEGDRRWRRPATEAVQAAAVGSSESRGRRPVRLGGEAGAAQAPFIGAGRRWSGRSRAREARAAC